MKGQIKGGEGYVCNVNIGESVVCHKSSFDRNLLPTDVSPDTKLLSAPLSIPALTSAFWKRLCIPWALLASVCSLSSLSLSLHLSLSLCRRTWQEGCQEVGVFGKFHTHKRGGATISREHGSLPHCSRAAADGEELCQHSLTDCQGVSVVSSVDQCE